MTNLLEILLTNPAVWAYLATVGGLFVLALWRCEDADLPEAAAPRPAFGGRSVRRKFRARRPRPRRYPWRGRRAAGRTTEGRRP